MDLLIGTYTEGTMRLVLMESLCRANAVAGDRARHSAPLFYNPPSLPILYVVENSARRRRPRQCVFLERQRVFSLSRQSSLGEDPCHLSISPDGQLLRLPTTRQGVVVFKLDDDGRFG